LLPSLESGVHRQGLALWEPPTDARRSTMLEIFINGGEGGGDGDGGGASGGN
jgi:hypothetical protein